ncbi:mitochondrial carrier domain-containing protein [Russula earlei]|uniref:Mitochondrial carrier domain-containing protein n=1 Tax=Russula earlei TaxID=71964 RepID=A0ACC0UG59_9AGAM|nr:mitochondrial carrier domain-containing protein [Russula earlei]
MSDSFSQGNGNHKLDPTLDFLAGTVAGVSGLIVGFPLDTVKYRFQNPSRNVQYRSTLHALTTITREERFRALYKGISSPLVRKVMVASNATAPLLNGLLFATYRFLMKIQMHHDNVVVDQEPTLGQVFLAGGGCGLASTLLTTPIELVKVQQQKQQQHLSSAEVGRVAPARAVALHICRSCGLRGLYRGLSATMVRDVGGYGLYFSGYEGTLRLFAPAKHARQAEPVLDEVEDTLSRPWAPLLVAGGAAGIAQDVGAEARTSWRTAREMSAEAGWRVFWRGLVPTIIRAVPVNMAVFGTFEGVVWAFS